ncbi:hypothetical protein HYH03_013295 [Edaphochlamys debaryana]|uniref:DUF676 domain-containing protein n=1 Tax=Edaphochlamys debaryana TaxID=47281 RepID=A0A835XRA6_9CHLO|nr:hypothetical protein HYH03_013295 [Edaphochlamys debaryana]|eukprot:KAG2488152.1 hypothetical protein HYH03_013295 [Edaphochlamys debaryana]
MLLGLKHKLQALSWQAHGNSGHRHVLLHGGTPPRPSPSPGSPAAVARAPQPPVTAAAAATGTAAGAILPSTPTEAPMQRLEALFARLASAVHHPHAPSTCGSDPGAALAAGASAEAAPLATALAEQQGPHTDADASTRGQQCCGCAASGDGTDSTSAAETSNAGGSGGGSGIGGGGGFSLGRLTRWRSSHAAAARAPSTASDAAAAAVTSPLFASASQSPRAASAAAGAQAPGPTSGRGGPAASAGPSGSGRPQGPAGGGATHLIIFANGLFGSPSNWSVIVEKLRERLDPKTVVLHPSQVNRLTATYDGIDVCGRRLADEIRAVAAAHPGLQRISVVGHSMGGLLLRYALGLLYDPSTGRVAGLRPAHFVTLATPHCGCDAEGLAQVPFIGWVAGAPPVQKVLQVLSVPTAGLMFRRTGRQFFMADAPASASSSSPAAAAAAAAPRGRGLSTAQAGARAGGGSAAAAGADGPLLFRMTQDDPARGEYFYSALASFASRTAYANTDGDHLVGWANSSLRFMHQLPRLPPQAAQARGVVLQDPLLAAFDVRHKPDREPQSAAGSADLPIDLPPATASASASTATSTSAAPANALGAAKGPASPRAASNAAKPDSAAAALAAAAYRGLASAGSGDYGDSDSTGAYGGGGGGAGPSPAATAARAETMLRRLQRLPWRRIDVSFRGALFGFAHNNIQVTRRWMNFEGMAVAGHLAEQVAELEAQWHRMEAARAQAGPAGPGSGAGVTAGAMTRLPSAGTGPGAEASPLLPVQGGGGSASVSAETGAAGPVGVGAGAGCGAVGEGARTHQPLLTEAQGRAVEREMEVAEPERTSKMVSADPNFAFINAVAASKTAYDCCGILTDGGFTLSVDLMADFLNWVLDGGVKDNFEKACILDFIIRHHSSKNLTGLGKDLFMRYLGLSRTNCCGKCHNPGHNKNHCPF